MRTPRKTRVPGRPVLRAMFGRALRDGKARYAPPRTLATDSRLPARRHDGRRAVLALRRRVARGGALRTDLP